MSSSFWYTAGRMGAVATRPLCLLVVNNYAPQAASGLAAAFVVTTLALTISAAGAHRRFYHGYFAAERPESGLGFYVYAASLVVLTLVGLLSVVGLSAYFASPAALTVAIGVYFAAEKLADELMRLKLFERDLAGWGRASMKRIVVQIVGLGAVFLFVPLASIDAWPLVIVLAAGNFVVFVPQLPRGVAANLALRSGTGGLWLWRRAVAALRADWLLWAIPLLSALVSYLDRVVALLVDEAMLPMFTLVLMCFSILPLVVDFYFASQYRREFLDRQISVAKAVRSPRFLLSFGAGLLVSGAACAIVLLVSRSGSEFPLAYVGAIAALQVIASLANIPREILYWTHAVGAILRIEGWFWVLFILAGVATWASGARVGGILLVAIACAAVRLWMYVVSAVRALPTPHDAAPAAR
jgi:hypothetical protein